MKAFIRHIGVIDHGNKVHSVTFSSGVNVVTGKSSTGKSALIEIFDFCFGSSDFTVPEGVITKCADIYFVVMQVQESNLILARRRQGKNAFIKNETDDLFVIDPHNFSLSYFDSDYFLPLNDFKKVLSREFGLRITDAEENLTAREYRGRKSASPSVRSFVSFMLQHQNLVANKHAIFYRFDEKEKREQVIEHLKVFLGFADQTYFVKSQELNALMAEKRGIELQIPRLAVRKKNAAEKLQSALDEYVAISGHELKIGNMTDVVTNPRPVLDYLQKMTVEVVAVSDEHVRLKQEAERELAKLTAKLRKGQQKLSAIKSSIQYAKIYTEEAEAVAVPTEAELLVSKCPFCNAQHSSVEHEANRLNDAILWLNEELSRSKYLLESFEEQEQKTYRELDDIRSEVSSANQKIRSIDSQIVELERYRTQYELALKAKLHVESILEQLLDKPYQEFEKQLTEIKVKISELNRFLKNNYNVEHKLNEAEKRIWSLMADIGNRFEFEESYRPINLYFSLKTFDLWHEFNSRKVFLRSMGSGANWLYCHLTLFLALHRYFCSLGAHCLIPSILFIDQPSQVYFPSVLDNAIEFSPKEIADKEGAARKRPVDEDIKAVTNLYSQLVKFCQETLKETGIEPQIIVTDHADNLTLDGNVPFESLVQGRRWRMRGFIENSEIS